MSHIYIPHILCFLLVAWLVSLAYFAREAGSPGAAIKIACMKTLRYTAWTILLVLVMWGLEALFIYSG